MTDEILGPPPDGATPLGDDNLESLRATWIATREDLNEAELANIIKARLKWRSRRLGVEDLCTDTTAKRLHADMFGDVWAWAGRYRTRDLSIGIAYWDVPVAVRDLMADLQLWLGGGGPMPVDEVGVRFHHRLVYIHPFLNGNGRHSREMTDLLLSCLGERPFTWGRTHLAAVGDVRDRYVAALRQADRGDCNALLQFVRS